MANISSLPEIAMYNAIVRRVKTISNSVKTEAANQHLSYGGEKRFLLQFSQRRIQYQDIKKNC